MTRLEHSMRRLVAAQLEVREALVTPTASFTADLGADSLALVELILAVEQHFELEIPDEIAPQVMTLRALTAYAAEHQGTRLMGLLED